MGWVTKQASSLYEVLLQQFAKFTFVVLA